jgi:hypothetical protein
MERSWLAQEVLKSEYGTPDRVVTRGVRTLRWDEIARLIEINPDGSWYPTEFAKTWMTRAREEAREE